MVHSVKIFHFDSSYGTITCSLFWDREQNKTAVEKKCTIAAGKNAQLQFQVSTCNDKWST